VKVQETDMAVLQFHFFSLRGCLSRVVGELLTDPKNSFQELSQPNLSGFSMIRPLSLLRG
jgi:hypothetical protein